MPPAYAFQSIRHSAAPPHHLQKFHIKTSVTNHIRLHYASFGFLLRSTASDSVTPLFWQFYQPTAKNAHFCFKTKANKFNIWPLLLTTCSPKSQARFANSTATVNPNIQPKYGQSSTGIVSIFNNKFHLLFKLFYGV